MFKSSKKMKIFGIGLPKTGTTSLSKALKILGYSSKHYPRDLNEIEEYDSATDSLVAINFKLLDKEYPDSKFVLTTRNLDEWLTSVKKHREKLMIPKKGTKAYELRLKSMGSVDYNERKLSKKFREHHKNVSEYFKRKPDKLLIMDISKGDGWDKLAPFLESRTPHVPFPKENVKSSNSLAEQQRKN